MNDDMHLVMFAIHRLIAALTAAEPATLISVQGDVNCNTVKKHLTCHAEHTDVQPKSTVLQHKEIIFLIVLTHALIFLIVC